MSSGVLTAVLGGPTCEMRLIPSRGGSHIPGANSGRIEAAKLADAFELAVEGTGVSYMKRFADDPEFLCGTRPPGWPRPKKDDERFLEPEVLGAALDFVAEGVGNEEVAGAARELGRGMIG